MEKIDRLPRQPKKGERYRVREIDEETGEIIRAEYEIVDMRENETTDKTQGAVIITAKRKKKVWTMTSSRNMS
jgi:hypothetical protein